MELQTGSKLGKEYIKAVYCHPAYLTYMKSTSCEMLGWMKHKLESRLPGEIPKPKICRWYHPHGKKQSGTKGPLNEAERGEWKSWLKTQHSEDLDHGIRSHHFMANRWETMQTDRLYFLGSKITADGDCSLEIKRRLLLGQKAMTILDSTLKSRDITLPTKVCIVKAMVFPVVMYGCESWIIKKAERWRIDAFELWCWRLFRVPWTARRSNQSILKEIHPEYSLEGLMLKLKHQYFGYVMWRANSLEKTLMLGKIEGRMRRGWQRLKWLDGTTSLMGMSLSSSGRW